jgi:hypothetical protein
MAKSKKNVKTIKVAKHWFSSRNWGRSSITAIRSSINTPGQTIEHKTDSKPEVKPLKEGGNMWYVQKILKDNGRLELEKAIDLFLSVHKVESSKPRDRAKMIFLQSSKYRVPVKIEKVGKEVFLELA